jgi:hypothetical protein
MTSRHRLAKRCARLEDWAQEQRRPLEVALQREEEWLRALEGLATAFPEQRQDQLRAFLLGDRFKGSGLEAVLLLIERGFWQPVPIPPMVAEVFLAEPDVQPGARCAGCGTVFPHRMGIWRNTETGKSWQAPLCYFRCCPCGGAIVYSRGNPVDIRPWLPERVVPPWTFVDDRALWEQRRARTGRGES